MDSAHATSTSGSWAQGHLDGDFALALNANGTMVRLQKVEHFAPSAFTVLGWDVSDIRSTVAKLTEGGVKFEKYRHPDQDELGIWSSPSGARVSGPAVASWFKDPEGNILSLTELRHA